MPQSERLTYRLVTDDDAELLRTHWNHPEVRQYLWDGHAVDSDQVATAIERAGRAHREFRGGLWCLLVGGRFVGVCGLLPVFPELDALLSDALPDGIAAAVGNAPMVEVLYSLERSDWGNGYAVEATRALLAYGHSECRIPVIFGGTDVPNERSARTLAAAGLTEITRFHGDAGPLVYFVSTVNG